MFRKGSANPAVMRSVAAIPVSAIFASNGAPSATFSPMPITTQAGPPDLRPQLDENPAQFPLIDQQIVRPFQLRTAHTQHVKCTQLAYPDHQPERAQIRGHVPERPTQRQTNRATRGRQPRPSAPPATGGLILGEHHLARPVRRIRAGEQHGVCRPHGPGDFETAHALPHIRRKLLLNPLRRQRLTRFRQPIAAVANGVQSGAQVAQRLHRLPDSTPAYAERLRKILAGVELPIRQLGKNTGNSIGLLDVPITRSRAVSPTSKPARARLGTRTHARDVGSMRECNQDGAQHTESLRAAPGAPRSQQHRPRQEPAPQASTPSPTNPNSITATSQVAASAAAATDRDPTRRQPASPLPCRPENHTKAGKRDPI